MEDQLSPSTLSHLLQHTLRSFCINENSQWLYAVFWRILPRNYPPPKWDTQGGAYDRSRGNRRNWILAWEDGFCNFAASTASSGDSPAYGHHEYHHYQGLQPELFFKMSHEIYNYGEGYFWNLLFFLIYLVLYFYQASQLIGKVAADHSHKWIFKEPTDQDFSFLSAWNNSADSHTRTWEAQFQAGIKVEMMVRKKLSYIESIPGVLLPHPSSSSSLNPYKSAASNMLESWLFQRGGNVGGGGGDLQAVYIEPTNITPSMSSLEALLSKLPSVVPVNSLPAGPPYFEAAQPHYVAVSPEKEADEENFKDLGECSSSMSSYGHQHQLFQHHYLIKSSTNEALPQWYPKILSNNPSRNEVGV
ncbi:hypothetical protein R6Q57_014973 [Mikania cordata]